MFKFIDSQNNETFKATITRYFRERKLQECKLNIYVEVGYDINGSATTY